MKIIYLQSLEFNPIKRSCYAVVSALMVGCLLLLVGCSTPVASAPCVDFGKRCRRYAIVKPAHLLYWPSLGEGD